MKPKFSIGQLVKFEKDGVWYYNNVVNSFRRDGDDEHFYILDGPADKGVSKVYYEFDLHPVGSEEDAWLRKKVNEGRLQFDIDSGNMYTSDGEVYAGA